MTNADVEIHDRVAGAIAWIEHAINGETDWLKAVEAALGLLLIAKAALRPSDNAA